MCIGNFDNIFNLVYYWFEIQLVFSYLDLYIVCLFIRDCICTCEIDFNNVYFIS